MAIKFSYNKFIMVKPTFLTGNKNKAEYLSRYIGLEIPHQKIDLIEIQSLDLTEVVNHKAKQAYEILGSPVLVEDVSLEFNALGKLPGTFIKFFLEEMSEEQICRLLDGKDKTAIARCIYVYYDGVEVVHFKGELKGQIAQHPAGNNGYGWDKIFIPEGYNITRAEMDESNDKSTYLKLKPLQQIKEFLLSS